MALYAVREVAPERAETQAVTIAALDDPDAEVRRAALTSLAKLIEPDRACLDRALRVLAEDADLRMRRIAAVVIPDLALPHPDAVTQARSALEAVATPVFACGLYVLVDGRFALDVSMGAWTHVSVLARGYAAYVNPRQRVDAGTIRIRLSPGIAVTVRTIEKGTERPLAGVRVGVTQSAGQVVASQRRGSPASSAASGSASLRKKSMRAVWAGAIWPGSAALPA